MLRLTAFRFLQGSIISHLPLHPPQVGTKLASLMLGMQNNNALDSGCNPTHTYLEVCPIEQNGLTYLGNIQWMAIFPRARSVQNHLQRRGFLQDHRKGKRIRG